MLPLPAGREASAGVGASVYERQPLPASCLPRHSYIRVHHRPERTLLYQLVEDYYLALKAHLAAQGTALPGYVEREFEAYLKCGRLEHGFLRVRCDGCHAEHLVAFSCKRRGFCGSCGARRMAESAALLVDEIFPAQPVRQWVLSFPYPLRFLFASRPAIMGQVLGIVYRCIATHLIKAAPAHPCAPRHSCTYGPTPFARHLISGLMCADGRGTPKDLCQACAWLDLAASQHDEDASQLKKTLRERMTAAEITQADNLSREFRSRFLKKPRL